MSDEASTSRTSVKAYVPAYQKEEWQTHADALDMSQSEFVKTMVQAGRRRYTPGEETGRGGQSEATTIGEGDHDGFSERVIALLESDEALSWEELYEKLTDDIETRLDEALDELQASNAIKYSGREGGYTLIET